MNRKILLGLIGLGLLLVTMDAFAQATNLKDPAGSFNGLLDLIQQEAGKWGPRLRGYAFALFWGLAAIQFTWNVGQLAFKGADLGDVVGELVRQIMTIGFWLACLTFSVDWMDAVVKSFREAAGYASGQGKGLFPADVFLSAVSFAKMIFLGVETYNPISALAITVSALVVLACFVFIAAFMTVALVESYIVINAGVIMLGFAGASWTRDMTMAFLKYCVSVGAKLFVLTLIVGLALGASEKWAAAYQHDDASMFTFVGLSLVLAYICKTIPETIQGVISGVSMGGGGAMGGLAAASTAVGVAGVAAMTAMTGGAGGLAAAAGAGLKGALGSAAGNAAGGAASGAGSLLSGGARAASAAASGAGSPMVGGGGGGGSGSMLGSRLGGASSMPGGGMSDSAKPAGAQKNADAADKPSVGSRAKQAGLSVTKGAWALGAMATPGMEAAPDPTPFLNGDSSPDPQVNDDLEAHLSPPDAAASESENNIIRPAIEGVDNLPPSRPK